MVELHTKDTDRLFEAVLRLESVDECYDFFRDLCTIKELQDMSQRLSVAVMLDEGNSYQAISERTGMSAATISRVNKCLMYGNDGYRMAIDRLREAGICGDGAPEDAVGEDLALSAKVPMEKPSADA